jgi:hypothetical protein
MIKLYVSLSWNIYSSVLSYGIKKGKAGQWCQKDLWQCPKGSGYVIGTFESAMVRHSTMER